MRVDLVVGNQEAIQQAERALEAFRQAVRPAEFPELGPEVRAKVDRNMNMAPRGVATAAWVPAVRTLPEYAEFSFSSGFFELDRDGQTIILLHEAAHIRLYRTRLIENYKLIRALPRFSAATNAFETDRENLAWEVLTFAQEVGVDRFLASADYPPALRARYFRDRARAFYLNGEGHQYDDARSPALAKFRLFFGLLRTELGLLLVTDEADRARLLELRNRRNEEFERQAGTELPWFRGVQERLLGIRVDTDASDTDPYRELSDRILATSEGERR